jgi:hypothetical protein
MPDLAEKIRTLIDSGAPPVTFEDVLNHQISVTTDSGMVSSITKKQSTKRLMRRWWMLPGVAAALALALVLVNASGSPSEADALQLVRSSPNVALHTARSSHYVETVTARSLSGAVYVSVNVVGSEDPLADTFDQREDVYRTASHVFYFQFEYLSDGKSVYQSVPSYVVARGNRPWIAFPVKSSGPKPASTSPTDSVLRDARGPVKDLGNRTIAGTVTKGYALTVSSGSIVKRSLPAERQLQAESFSTVKNVRVEVWLDGTGRPVANKLSWFSPANSSTGEALQWVASVRVTYSNQPSAITPPASDQVAFVLNAAQASALLGHEENTL